MNVPLCRPYFGPEEFSAVCEVLSSGWLAHGPANKEFEKMLADYLGVARVVSLNSCTSALYLALLANGVKGEVLIPSFTFVATANAVVTAGATPVFVDVEYDTCNIDVDKLEASITPRTEAIIAVHFGGQACRMDALMAIAAKRHLLLIEDSAQTLGGTYRGRLTGSFGLGCFSFYPTKNLTTGEGGALTTSDVALADRIAALSAHGIAKHAFDREAGPLPWHRAAACAGYNFRMSSILAALGIVQLRKLDEMNAARRDHAAYYGRMLKDIEAIDLPVEVEGCFHVYQMYTLKVRDGDRDELVRQMNRNGIGASVHYTPAVHQQDFYRGKFAAPAGLDVTERLARRILTLPMYPHMQPHDRDAVVRVLRRALGVSAG